ncbi:MAG TPA: hypothetical protein EYN96_11965, partial [Candidatus Hydrogenedentes bacterium]|nr:hypothetical protein [Candidatus Hydrogenedentota bacterium]
KEFATYIQIIDPPEAIRTGLTAEVEVLVNTLANQLMIPVQTLHEDQGQAFCLVRSPYDHNNPMHADTLGGKHGDPDDEFSVEIRHINYLASNNKFLAIKDGLTAGEMVVMNPRSEESILIRLVTNYRARKALDTFSTDGNSTLSEQEGKDMNKKLGYEAISSFSSVDTNKDGEIDISELGNLIDRTQNLLEVTEQKEINVEEVLNSTEQEDPLAEFKERAESRVANFWSAMDKNGDAKLDKDEIAATRDPAGIQLDDTNKDGEVSKEEFITGMAKRMKNNAESGGGSRPGGEGGR